MVVAGSSDWNSVNQGDRKYFFSSTVAALQLRMMEWKDTGASVSHCLWGRAGSIPTARLLNAQFLECLGSSNILAGTQEQFCLLATPGVLLICKISHLGNKAFSQVQTNSLPALRWVLTVIKQAVFGPFSYQ